MDKIIHYCWFGGNEKPSLALKCIESWKKFFPDYEIKEWNESNFDIHCIPYVEEAYRNKKWAFVSDFARFWILYNYGGLYFDTDVEIIKDFSDIISKGSFLGCEYFADNRYSNSVNAGLGMGAEKQLKLYKEILESYENSHFQNNDGTLNLQTVVDRVTSILIEKGFNPNQNDIQLIEDIYIYPCDFFCPMNYNSGTISVTSNTHSIHHYMASWHTDKDAYANKLRLKFVKFLPDITAKRIARLLASVRYDGIKNTIRYIRKK